MGQPGRDAALPADYARRLKSIRTRDRGYATLIAVLFSIPVSAALDPDDATPAERRQADKRREQHQARTTGSEGAVAEADTAPAAGNDWLLKVVDLKTHYLVRQGVFRVTGAVVRAVDGVSFTLQRNETLGIVGESGCGKSTVAKTILGIVGRHEARRSGQIMFRHEGTVIDVNTTDTRGLRQVRKHVQMVFQDPESSLKSTSHRSRHHRRAVDRQQGSIGSGGGSPRGRADAGGGSRSSLSETVPVCLQRRPAAASGSASASPAPWRWVRS